MTSLRRHVTAGGVIVLEAIGFVDHVTELNRKGVVDVIDTASLSDRKREAGRFRANAPRCFRERV